MPTINAQPTKPIAQACVVPYRRRDERIEFCLITSLKKKRWIFPKGIVDPGETVEEAALKEAFEEAGLHGRILGDPIGKYEDSKWGTNPGDLGCADGSRAMRRRLVGIRCPITSLGRG